MSAVLLFLSTSTLRLDLTVAWPFIPTFLIAFLLGSIPCGLIISKLFYKKDIRESGSGNIGTTNAMRTLGKVGGAAVFVLDFGKGLLSGFLAQAIMVFSLQIMGYGSETGLEVASGGEVVASDIFLHLFSPQTLLIQSCTATAFAGCVLGHVYSPWLKFKGGKGIAVAIGCAFVVFGWWLSWLLLGIFIVLVLTTRYVSVGSLAAAVSCIPVAVWRFSGNWYAIAMTCIVSAIIIWAHRENIKRLLAHTENRIGSKKKSKGGTD